MGRIICSVCKELCEEEKAGLCRRCYSQERCIRKWWDEQAKKEKAKPEPVLEYRDKLYAEKIDKDREARQARWHAKNKEREQTQARTSYLKRTHGLTITEYDEILEAQSNGCWICGKAPEEIGKRLSVDHDHSTGKIRGLLCVNCNIGLGNFRDDPRLLTRAIEYLTQDCTSQD